MDGSHLGRILLGLVVNHPAALFLWLKRTASRSEPLRWFTSLNGIPVLQRVSVFLAMCFLVWAFEARWQLGCLAGNSVGRKSQKTPRGCSSAAITLGAGRNEFPVAPSGSRNCPANSRDYTAADCFIAADS